MAELISRAELARRAGVSRSGVTKALKGPLAPSITAGRVDAHHPLIIAFLAKHGAKSKPTGPEGEAQGGADLDDIPPEDLMILRGLAEKHGAKRGFRDWLDALKRREEIRKLRLDNEETEGRLINRDLVAKHVFGAIEAVNRRLLVDVPKSAALRVYAASSSGQPVEEGERIIREIIGSQLKPLKANAARVLRES